MRRYVSRRAKPLYPPISPSTAVGAVQEGPSGVLAREMDHGARTSVLHADDDGSDNERLLIDISLNLNSTSIIDKIALRLSIYPMDVPGVVPAFLEE